MPRNDGIAAHFRHRPSCVENSKFPTLVDCFNLKGSDHPLGKGEVEYSESDLCGRKKEAQQLISPRAYDRQRDADDEELSATHSEGH